jgi:hypothetical protein
MYYGAYYWAKYAKNYIPFRLGKSCSKGRWSVSRSMLMVTIALQVEKKDIKVCAKEADECAGLRVAYAHCKRGQLDPRTRIKGNKGY